MAVDWIQNKGKKTSSYANNVDSKAALLAIAYKHTTHSLAVATRLKTIKLRNSTSIAFHWVKGHTGLKGNERVDYLVKQLRVTILPRVRRNPNQSGKADTGRLLHKNLERNISKLCKCLPHKTIHTHHLPQTFPSSLAQLLLTQFLTNHGSFRSYLHKMDKTPSPNCNFPEKAIQTARNLLLECSLFSNNRPQLLKSLPPALVLKHHINTFSITSFLRSIFSALQEESKGN
jgi:hypothetical protein